MIIYRNTILRKGDTFRELLSMWEESGYCKLETNNDPFCWWVDEDKEVLLYDHPRFDYIPHGWEYALFANTQLNCDEVQGGLDGRPKCSPWIFWSRHPRKLEKSIEQGIPTYQERKTKSIFLGKVENDIQLDNRQKHDWSSCIEKFSMPIAIGDVTSYPYTQEEYLNEIKNSKFGLCLPGYGPKCNREIEYLGSGTVPIMTPGCGLEYYDELREGTHYLKADTPDDVLRLVDSVMETEWNFLSENGRSWYNRNCSRKGSFETTKKIIGEMVHGLD